MPGPLAALRSGSEERFFGKHVSRPPGSIKRQLERPSYVAIAKGLFRHLSLHLK